MKRLNDAHDAPVEDLKDAQNSHLSDQPADSQKQDTQITKKPTRTGRSPNESSCKPVHLQLDPTKMLETPTKADSETVSAEETDQVEDIFDDIENKQDEKASYWILKERKFKLGSSTWTIVKPDPEETFEQVKGRMPSGEKEKPKQYLVSLSFFSEIIFYFSDNKARNESPGEWTTTIEQF